MRVWKLKRTEKLAVTLVNDTHLNHLQEIKDNFLNSYIFYFSVNIG